MGFKLTTLVVIGTDCVGNQVMLNDMYTTNITIQSCHIEYKYHPLKIKYVLQVNADKLAAEVGSVVDDLAGGRGE
jgi:hypothetical protein